MNNGFLGDFICQVAEVRLLLSYYICCFIDSNHPFSGAFAELLVSGMVSVFHQITHSTRHY